MAQTAIYLHFRGNAVEAFNYYKKIFNTELSAPFLYIKDIPEMNALPENEQQAVMHVAMPILGGILLRGSDLLESMGHYDLKPGSNVTISLEPDTKEEADRLFKELSEDGSEISPMQHTSWGYMGCAKDKFGISWMFMIQNTTY